MPVMKVGKCPSDEVSLTNRVAVNEQDIPSGSVQHLEVRIEGKSYIFSPLQDRGIQRGYLGFSLVHRKWAYLSINQDIEVRPFQMDPNSNCIGSVVVELDFLQKKGPQNEQFDTDMMAKEFCNQFHHMALARGQPLVFGFQGRRLLQLVCKDIEVTDIRALKENRDVKPIKAEYGVILPNTTVTFEKAEGCGAILTGRSKGKTARPAIINPEWNFEKMGVGGLDKQFNAIFRRAFASRVFPPEVVEQLGAYFVRDILRKRIIYGSDASQTESSTESKFV